eukprot:6942849-Pyramimonas_sp.AAC.1
MPRGARPHPPFAGERARGGPERGVPHPARRLRPDAVRRPRRGLLCAEEHERGARGVDHPVRNTFAPRKVGTVRAPPPLSWVFTTLITSVLDVCAPRVPYNTP